MNRLKIYPGNINARYIDQAVDTLRAGGIIIYPTDTVYALGCDALNAQAIAKVCRIKGIDPAKQSLSIICSDLSMASDYARIDNIAFRTLRANTPGAFTFLLPSTTRLPKVMKGRRQVGIRIPGCDIARALAEALGHPLLSTSAEATDESDDDLSASANPDSVAVAYEYHPIELIIDGGYRDGILSTVVDLDDPSDPVIVRQGPAPLIF
ncbi:MAG: L-threonylcarbamoyladenylate synthase [Pseudoflavonifractor sp.]|nr:L-threonylcarbamoyladenylate synthase [Alloprevotella sp.]MCM1117532.1 L-threonylcarbamoyladenylate synthase [Pseudoflavonifractor sp.]